MTSYPPLADVRKSLRVDWYRCPIEPAKLRELSKRSDLQGWFQAKTSDNRAIWPL